MFCPAGQVQLFSVGSNLNSLAGMTVAVIGYVAVYGVLVQVLHVRFIRKTGIGSDDDAIVIQVLTEAQALVSFLEGNVMF